jgi:hypothetical protein
MLNVLGLIPSTAKTEHNNNFKKGYLHSLEIKQVPPVTVVAKGF